MADLKRRIMRRVYFVWAVRRVAHSVSLKLALVVLLVWQLTTFISVKNVLANVPRGSDGSLFEFLAAAFLNTEVASWAIATLLAAVGVWLVRGLIARKVEESKTFVRT